MEKPKILIADDEKPTRDAMARILSPSCECLTAPDAELAMKLVEENPDLALLLTDYKMPGENGVSLIKRAKAANPSLACILITAFGEIELAVEAMKEGADDFITKPITDLAQMEQRVKKALRLYDGQFFVKTDFKKFYESISHDLVMRELTRRYKDKRFLTLVDKFVLNYHSDVEKELEDERRKRTANRTLYKSAACERIDQRN